MGGIYGQLSMDVDKYLYQHEDFFVLFAGGNEGYSGLRSVIAPGNAKNCLTVGATQLRTVVQDEELDDPVRMFDACLTEHMAVIASTVLSWCCCLGVNSAALFLPLSLHTSHIALPWLLLKIHTFSFSLSSLICFFFFPALSLLCLCHVVSSLAV